MQLCFFAFKFKSLRCDSGASQACLLHLSSCESLQSLAVCNPMQPMANPAHQKRAKCWPGFCDIAERIAPYLFFFLRWDLKYIWELWFCRGLSSYKSVDTEIHKLRSGMAAADVLTPEEVGSHWVTEMLWIAKAVVATSHRLWQVCQALSLPKAFEKCRLSMIVTYWKPLEDITMWWHGRPRLVPNGSGPVAVASWSYSCFSKGRGSSSGNLWETFQK